MFVTSRYPAGMSGLPLKVLKFCFPKALALIAFRDSVRNAGLHCFGLFSLYFLLVLGLPSGFPCPLYCLRLSLDFHPASFLNFSWLPVPWLPFWKIQGCCLLFSYQSSLPPHFVSLVCDSSFRLSHLFLFVNTFFIFFLALQTSGERGI